MSSRNDASARRIRSRNQRTSGRFDRDPQLPPSQSSAAGQACEADERERTEERRTATLCWRPRNHRLDQPRLDRSPHRETRVLATTWRARITTKVRIARTPNSEARSDCRPCRLRMRRLDSCSSWILGATAP